MFSDGDEEEEEEEGRVQADPSNVSEMDDAASELLLRPHHDTEVTQPRRRGEKRHPRLLRQQRRHQRTRSVDGGAASSLVST